MMKKPVLKLTARVKRFSAINEKAFTLIELMIVVAILGILASVAVGAFDFYVKRSKTSEVSYGIGKMVEGEIRYHTENSRFLDAGPINIPPSAQKVAGDFNADTSWNSLGFGFSDPILFGYQATVTGTDSVDCMAMGDLDGDGETSLFKRTITFSNGSILPSGLYVFDELE